MKLPHTIDTAYIRSACFIAVWVGVAAAQPAGPVMNTSPPDVLESLASPQTGTDTSLTDAIRTALAANRLPANSPVRDLLLPELAKSALKQQGAAQSPASRTAPNNQPQKQGAALQQQSTVVPPPLDHEGLWRELLSFRPPEDIQRQVMGHAERQLQFMGAGPAYVSWFVQRIEDGVGPVSFDYHPVWIQQLPKVAGKGVISIEEMLALVRLNLNRFTGPRLAYWEPYNYEGRCCRVELGGYVFIAMAPDDLGTRKYYIAPEAGSVVVSLSEPARWRFSTIYANGHRYLDDGGKNHPNTPRSQTSSGGYYHPVSGNREFGARPHPDGGWIIYTAGADRLSKWSAIPNALRIVPPGHALDDPAFDQLMGEFAFRAQKALWSSLQSEIVAFINAHGGSAKLMELPGGASCLQVFKSWPSQVQQGLWRPATAWVDTFGSNGRYMADKAPTRPPMTPHLLKSLDQLDTGNAQRDPPRAFEKPDWMSAFFPQDDKAK